jgi:hypothetical protein
MAEIRWLGPYAPSDRHADDETVADMVWLRKERDRYRDALERITKAQYNADSKDIASTALEQTGD